MVLLLATNTHLYRGARVSATGVFPADPGPVRIVFRDGAEIDAELLPGERDGALVLAMPAHRTAAGQDIAAKRWNIARVEPDAAGETAVLGRRLA
ncbi:MAG: hypothetical protein QM677_02030 [Microbacterium sp.]